MPETMSEGLFAKRHHVTRKTVQEWRWKGYVVLADDGMVDVAASEKRLRARPQKYRGGVARSLFTPAKRFDLGVEFGPLPPLDDPFA